MGKGPNEFKYDSSGTQVDMLDPHKHELPSLVIGDGETKGGLLQGGDGLALFVTENLSLKLTKILRRI